MKNDVIFHVRAAPIHTHKNERTGDDELCGKVFCPYGFVEVTITHQRKEI